MVKATIQQLHVPQLCKCKYHQPVFTCSQTEQEFISHKAMTEKLASWQRQQGQDACWVYSIVKVS